LIERAAETLVKHSTANFYFNDAKTLLKMSNRHPEFVSREFKIALHEKIIDYIITVGGDGTILYAAKEFVNEVPPLISFQRGSLGFMCRFPLASIEAVLEKTVSFHLGRTKCPFKRANIMRLHVGKTSSKVPGESVRVCINEVFISRKAQERISIEISVNGEHLTHTAGDGILISTPTGSTAYSLSAGGPLLQNGVNGILIVPIAPNSLSFRPICFPSDCEIRIKVLISLLSSTRYHDQQV